MIDTLLVPDRVFDGHTVAERIAVGVAGDRIVYVGPEDAAPAAARRERLEGVTLLPGLIDMHVHVTSWSVFGFLAAGVTSVRDLGNDVELAERNLARVPAGMVPRIHWVGPVLDGPHANWPALGRAHRTPEEMARSVHELADRGMRTVKLYANVDGASMAAAVRAGAERGIRVVGHNGLKRLREAAEAGVAESQHLSGALAADLGVEPGPAAIEAFLAIEIDHCPTLVVWEGMSHAGEPRAHRDRGRDWVPAGVERGWRESHHAGMSSEERAVRLDGLIERMRLVRALRDAGRRIVVGSDACFIGLSPGFSLHDEVGLLVQSGLEPIEALRAVTSGNAEVLGEAGEVGCISSGAQADLLAVAGDPTSWIADLARVEGVWLGGARIDPVALRAAADVEFAQPLDGAPDLLARQRFIPAAPH